MSDGTTGTSGTPAPRGAAASTEAVEAVEAGAAGDGAEARESSLPHVAVLGSSRLAEDHEWWQRAHELGALLAAAGYTVVTGGYGGLMAAVSRGAHEAGGHVIGLPMRGWRALTPNPWNDELRWADDYGSRLAHLLRCEAVLALPGGVGTLAEMFTTWAAVQTEPEAPALVVLGEGWAPLLDVTRTHFLVTASDAALMYQASTPADAIAHIQRFTAALTGASGGRPVGRGPSG